MFVFRVELISGTILLSTNNYDNRVGYVKITKNEAYVQMEVIDIDGNIIFEAKENIMLGSRPKYLVSLNISSKHIDVYRLY